jgi:IclR family transcriptional regulator, acetate operon repressor
MLPHVPVDESTSAPPIRSVARALDVLDALQRAPDGLALRDVSREVGMPKSTTLRHLTTLEERRYISRDPATGVYRLGLAIPSQAQFVAQVTQAVRPSLERLRDEFDETASLSMLDGNRTTLLEIVESRQAIRLRVEVGARGYLHATGIGKAIASTLPDSFIQQIVETTGLPEFTPKTVTDPARLREQLEQARARGFATSDEENELGSFGVAVPVPTEKLRSAIGVSIPTIRVDHDLVPVIADRLRSEAATIAGTLESRSG